MKDSGASRERGEIGAGGNRRGEAGGTGGRGGGENGRNRLHVINKLQH